MTKGFTTFTTSLSAFKHYSVIYSKNCWLSSTALPVIKESGEAAFNVLPRSMKFSTKGDAGLAVGYGIFTVVAITLGARGVENLRNRKAGSV